VTRAPVPAATAGTGKTATAAGSGANGISESLGATAARIAAGAASLPETARGFIEKMRPHAEAVAQAAGIPVSFLLAQAALETGWGRHQPRSADGASSNNLFGIKAGSSWTGAKAVAATTEYVAGKAVTALESFRAYASHTEAFQDFARLIRGNPRYAGVVANAGDAAAYARSLQQAGYATDPRYAEKLTRTIEAVARHTAGSGTQVLPAAAVKRSGSA
jgi:flagellar protein FlgJ